MATNNKQPKAAKAGPAERGLKVMTRTGTFWRGGRQWSTEATTVSLADLSPEQAEQIREEGAPGGQLLVEEVDIEAPAAKA